MYKLVGDDRKEYGPVSREVVLEWIAQRRANAETIVRFEEGAWKPLRAFDEFKEALAAAPPGTVGAVSVVSNVEPPPFSGIGSRTETNWASVVGIAAPFVCCCCSYIGPVLGLTFSFVGLSQIRSNPSRYTTGDILPKIGIGINIAFLLLHLTGTILNWQATKFLSGARSFNF